MLNGQVHVIPPHTIVFPNMIALHTDPEHWGSDADAFRPSRWLVHSTSGQNIVHSNTTGCSLPDGSCHGETFIEPRRGTYFPWSGGARICPGMKFSQVEFVALLATLFKTHFVHPVQKPGETQLMARERIREALEHHTFGVALQIRDPTQLVVSWTEQTNVTLGT